MSHGDVTRACRRCGEDKPLEAFTRDKRGKHGRRSICRTCDSKRAAEWQAANRDRHNATTAAYVQRNREKDAAKSAVWQAKRRGQLEQQPCEVCGSEDSQAHHDDYTRRLDVRWLCPTHHALADIERRAA
jgi:protein-arginine kinase activator protein McsA